MEEKKEIVTEDVTDMSTGPDVMEADAVEATKNDELQQLNEELEHACKLREETVLKFAEAAYEQCENHTFSAESIKEEFEAVCEANARITSVEEKISLVKNAEKIKENREKQISEANEKTEDVKAELEKAEQEVERLKAEVAVAQKTEEDVRSSVDKTMLISMVPESELKSSSEKDEREEQVATPQESENDDTNLCANCGAEFKPGEKFCGFCGSPLSEPEPEAQNTFCMKCGEKLEVDSKFCMNCGAQV